MSAVMRYWYPHNEKLWKHPIFGGFIYTDGISMGLTLYPTEPLFPDKNVFVGPEPPNWSANWSRVQTEKGELAWIPVERWRPLYAGEIYYRCPFHNVFEYTDGSKIVKSDKGPILNIRAALANATEPVCPTNEYAGIWPPYWKHPNREWVLGLDSKTGSRFWS